MNLSKLSFISIFTATVVAADTMGGLRHQPVLTPEEFVTADTTEGLHHQPVLTPEEFVIPLSVEGKAWCKEEGATCEDEFECCGSE